jgi:hypothetical protein
VLLTRRFFCGFGFAALARKRLLLQLALHFFLMTTCFGLSRGTCRHLALRLGARRGLLGLAQHFGIFDLDLVALDVSPLLAHLDADRLGRRTAATSELELGGLTALECDASRLAGHSATGLLLQIAQQRDFIFGRDLRIRLGRGHPGFLELHQQLLHRTTQFLREILYGYR